MSHPQTYTQEELTEILHLAIARQEQSEEFTHLQLLEIADELGISLQTLQEVQQDWQQQKHLQRNREAFDAYLRDKFRQKTISSLLITVFFIALDLLTGGGLSWSRYIILLAGLAISLNAWKTFQPKGAAYEKSYQRWQNQRQIKQTMSQIWHTVQKALQPNTIN